MLILHIKKAVYICIIKVVREEYLRQEMILDLVNQQNLITFFKEILNFFSYGKQSLEVVPFLRKDPFFGTNYIEMYLNRES